MQKNSNKPKLIITCGLMGSGKSTVINEFGTKNNIQIISSDSIRKELAGISDKEHKYEDFDEGIYSKEFSKKTYDELNNRAEKILNFNNSVVLDACFSKKWQRMNAKNVAVRSNSDFFCIEFVCPEEIIKMRLTKRFDSKEGVSDGRWAIYPAQKASFEKITEFSNNEYFIIDTSNSLEKCVSEIIKRVEGI